jgi:hypothetical protein
LEAGGGADQLDHRLPGHGSQWLAVGIAQGDGFLRAVHFQRLPFVRFRDGDRERQAILLSTFAHRG